MSDSSQVSFFGLEEKFIVLPFVSQRDKRIFFSESY